MAPKLDPVMVREEEIPAWMGEGLIAEMIGQDAADVMLGVQPSEADTHPKDPEKSLHHLQLEALPGATQELHG
jgi:hypothetical protein